MKMSIGPILDFDRARLYYDQRLFDEIIADSNPHPKAEHFRRNWQAVRDNPCSYKSTLRWCPECGGKMKDGACRWGCE